MTETKRKRIADRITSLKVACGMHGVDINEFNPHSFRLTKGEKKIDYYPSSGKCFYHDDRVWETVEWIAKFIEYEFGQKV